MKNDQKIIMENWRRFVKKTEASNDYGSMFLFEGKQIKEVPFFGRANRLIESKRGSKSFLAEWEKSADHTIKLLIEAEEADTPQEEGGMIQKVIFKLSSQAVYLMQSGGRALNMVLKVLDKLFGIARRFSERHPWITKVMKVLLCSVALVVLTGAAQAAAAAGVDYTAAIDFFLQWIGNIEMTPELQNLADTLESIKSFACNQDVCQPIDSEMLQSYDVNFTSGASGGKSLAQALTNGLSVAREASEVAEAAAPEGGGFFDKVSDFAAKVKGDAADLLSGGGTEAADAIPSEGQVIGDWTIDSDGIAKRTADLANPDAESFDLNKSHEKSKFIRAQTSQITDPEQLEKIQQFTDTQAEKAKLNRARKFK